MNNLLNIFPGGVSSNIASDYIADGVSAIFGLIIIILTIIALWKVFEKAGQPGWKALIPIYNAVIMFRIANWSGWLVILTMIPLVNIVVMVIFNIRLAKAFGRSVLFAIGLILVSPIFMLILAFDKSVFRGPYYGNNLASNPNGNASEGSATSAPAAAPVTPSSAPIDTTATSVGTPESTGGDTNPQA